MIYPDRINIYQVTRDGYGQTTETLVGANVPCRFVSEDRLKFQRLRTNERVTNLVYLPYNYDIQVNYKVYYQGKYYNVVGVYVGRDLFGKGVYKRVELSE